MAAAVTEIAWPEVERLAGVLAAALAEGLPPFDRVVAVARGGLVAAALVAGRLEIERVESVQVRHYDDGRRLPGPRLIGAAPAPSGPGGDPTRTLVVDEILESGATMRLLQGLLPAATCGVLLAKRDPSSGTLTARGLPAFAPSPGGAGQSVFAAGVARPDRWLLFPWSGARERRGGG
jgi:xanthine phosphoribosyltransferase